MALPPHRASVLLLVVLALAAIVFSSADAARAPAALEPEGAAVTDGGQAPTGSDDLPVEHVVVVDKRGGGGGHGHGGGEGGGSVGDVGSRGWGLGRSGYHGHGSGRGPEQSSSGGRDGVWKVVVTASVLGAAAWLL